ncbi:hypothetical protein GCM10011529_23490 [Polymorphobacter glacialis]|uniref:Uncharacterized protein n=1 Tax=Sandarakinorhabdus glacialis TaxID=1614636 RepID=A0A916ZW18_9SPHN|nr:hypothetical protein [Polymorphobacter glacialis]GGE16389.1 hypothetical protein GCM10011529_23490 [Polymorphobacter glacialis]
MRAALPLLAALVLSACGDQAEPAPVPDKNAEAIARIAAAPGGTTRWPPDAPAFIPQYPGGAVTAASGGNGVVGDTIVTFNTPDSPDAVVAFYQAQATKAGLARISALSTRQSTLFSAGDPATGRGMTIQAATRGDHTAAALSFARGRAPG